MILPIGSWVIQEACRQLRVWTDANRLWDDLTISINVSIRQFTHIDLPGEVERSLSLYEIDPGRLRLEITESTLIQDMDEILAVLRELKRLGVKLAIDDFGTGYSSLSYLRELPVDTLKIDRSFISGENRSPDSFQIVKSVTSMARSLGMTVVAEVYQQDILRDLQCDNAQGFLYSRPLKGDGVAEWILENGFLEQR
jgi:Amt family ammonium transporter